MATRTSEALDAALAVLTLVTGEDWDRDKVMEHSDDLRKVAKRALLRKGLSDADAELFINSRWAEYAGAIPEPEGARKTAKPERPSMTDIQARAAAWKAKRAAEEAPADPA